MMMMSGKRFLEKPRCGYIGMAMVSTQSMAIPDVQIFAAVSLRGNGMV